MFRVTTTFSGAYINGGGVQQFYFGDDGQTAANALTAVRTFWSGLAQVIASGTTITVEPEVEVVSVLTGQVTGTESGTGQVIAGGSAGEPLPPATQGLVRWRANFYINGRELRGRTFLPAMVESQNTAGIPSAGFLASVQPVVSALVNDANSTLLVYSRTHRQTASVSSGSVWSKWASLRSRRD